MIFHLPLPKGTQVGAPGPSGLAPRGGSSGVRRHLGSFRRRPRSRGRRLESLWWTGTATGHPIFGPTSSSDSRQRGVQEVVELASCVAERNADSEPPAGTAGAFGVSAGATRAVKRKLELRCRTAHGRRGSSTIRRTEGRESVRVRVRISRSRCARVSRRLQKSIGDAWFKKRLPVAAGDADGA